MRLHATPVSVYSCKVRLALALKGLAAEEVAPPGGYGSPELRAVVPQGTVPALEIAGEIVADSDAILGWLEDLAPAPPLWPADPLARARAREIDRWTDTRLEPAARALFPHVGRDAAPEAARGRLADALAVSARLRRGTPFACGPAPMAPDCGLLPVLAVCDLLDGALGLGLDLPRDVMAAGAGHPVAGPVLAAYGRALADWAAARGVTCGST